MTPHGMLLALAEDLDLTHLAGPADALVKKVCCDHREVGPGACFVAVPGSTRDGHDFLAQAAASGASALLVQNGREDALPADPAAACFGVDDPRAALGTLARSYRAKPDLSLAMIGVTGTNGKTTVAHLVCQILEHAGRRCGLLGTIRYETGRSSDPAPLTTPNPCEFHRLLEEMRSEGMQACAFEASSHALDQDRLGPIEVDVAAFTNLSREHLDYHADLESYLGAKRKLLDLLGGDTRDKVRGCAVVFVDDENLGAASWPEGSLLVGRRSDAQLRLLNAKAGREGTSLLVMLDGEELEFHSRLLGDFNVDNALVALGCGLALGLSTDELRGGLAAAQPVVGRMEPVELPGAALVLIDYAHTPDGLEAALAACRGLVSGRVHLVFGCGGDRDRGKRPLMGEVAVRGADQVYLTLDNPRTEDPAQIFRDAEAGMKQAYTEARARTVEDRAEAIAAALNGAKAEDLILIAGKGHENYQILGETKHPWDDREVIRSHVVGGEGRMSFSAYDLHEWLDAANVPHRLLRADGEAWSSEGGLADCRLEGAVIDSRQADHGLLFVAAAGEREHGVEYLGASLSAGAGAALVEGRVPSAAGRAEPVFLVEDIRLALGALARGWLDQWQPVVVGITGSNGKTTTKDMTRAALGDTRVGANPGNLNSGYGLPLAVLGQPEDLETLVLEMGASEPGEIERLAQITEPRVGCITNIGAAHLEFFGDLDGVFETKSALLAKLPENGCAVLPRDDSRFEELRSRSTAQASISFGYHEESDLRLESCVQEEDGLRVRIEGSEVLLPLFGEINGLNAAAACAIALALDVTVDESLPRLSTAQLSPHRSRLLRVAGRSVLDDCYNANPDSMLAALESLARLPIPGRRVAVLGSMAELGPDSPRRHTEVVTHARSVGVEEIYPVGDEMRRAMGVLEETAPDLSELGSLLAEQLLEGDAVLFKGSRSVGLERAVESMLQTLDDEGGEG